MGGRGASSGISKSGKIYGMEYHTVKRIDNIKFVKTNDVYKNNKAPKETMTKDRIYVYVNPQNKLKNITFFDENNKRYKTIDLDHFHNLNGKKIKPHVHLGYEHSEKGSRLPNRYETKIIDKVVSSWYH